VYAVCFHLPLQKSLGFRVGGVKNKCHEIQACVPFLGPRFVGIGLLLQNLSS
jgi:hypothetical protein